MDLSDLRENYTKDGLRRRDLHDDPIEQFESWFRTVHDAGVQEPNAMILATSDANNQPFTRTVLLKKFDSRGFVFFTNFESRKSAQIEENPKASLLFLWLGLERQVSINGSVEKISQKESLDYFISRPKGSQIGAWTSHQSSIIKSRAILEEKWEQMKRKFSEGKIPLPSFWGGYRVIPQSVEFWQGRQNRLHDRFLYRKNSDNEWSLERLQP